MLVWVRPRIEQAAPQSPPQGRRGEQPRGTGSVLGRSEHRAWQPGKGCTAPAWPDPRTRSRRQDVTLAGSSCRAGEGVCAQPLVRDSRVRCAPSLEEPGGMRRTPPPAPAALRPRWLETPQRRAPAGGHGLAPRGPGDVRGSNAVPTGERAGDASRGGRAPGGGCGPWGRRGSR